MPTAIPSQVKKYFWGDNLEELNWDDNRKYIIKTLLDKGDSKSVSWLLKRINSKELLKIIPSLNLSSKSDNFWKTYLS